MQPDEVFTAVGAALLALAVAVTRIQLRAHSCPRHQKSVGILAWLLAGFSAVSGIGLLLLGLA
ncbi:hypothetical protein [Thiogranum longum]